MNSTLQRPLSFKLAAIAAAFLATLAVFMLLARGQSPGVPAARDVAPLPPSASTDQLIAGYQRLARAEPGDASNFAGLAGAYLQKVRETADPSFYVRAEAALGRGERADPRNYKVLAGLGTLALARHDFRGGLRDGLAARRANPASNLSFPVIVDALVELGRYDRAGRELQAFVDRKPALASYARVSYFRELHGDLAGAEQAMRLAVSAGSAAGGENVSYVQTLLGNLEFDRGRVGSAGRAFRMALRSFPDYAGAQAGLARVEAARGATGPAIRRYRRLVARLPLPEYVVALGELELAAGRTAQGRRDLALVRVEERLLQANGVNTDVELAVFEANHGSPRAAVGLARRAWARAPSVRSADALGWALTRAGRPREGLVWARRALRLGSADPSFLHHAGMAALAAGDRADARGWLTASLARNPRWSPYHAPKARRALEGLR
jgi:tetratricopeptide (TPR) repeat protein